MEKSPRGENEGFFYNCASRLKPAARLLFVCQSKDLNVMFLNFVLT